MINRIILAKVQYGASLALWGCAVSLTLSSRSPQIWDRHGSLGVLTNGQVCNSESAQTEPGNPVWFLLYPLNNLLGPLKVFKV